MFIPGWLISMLTFPGIIIHEWAHKKICDWSGVKIKKVVYFRFGNPAGYVIHEEPKEYKQTFWISVGPLIINSIITIFLGIFASSLDSSSNLYLFVLWLAISIGMHSFPSDHDAKNVLEESRRLKEKSKIHYLAYPFFALIWLANKLSFFWLDVIYAIALIYISGAF